MNIANQSARRMTVLLTGAALAASGCTTRVTSVQDVGSLSNAAPESRNAIVGVPYSLPSAAYELEAKWTLTGCEIVETPKYADGKRAISKNWTLVFDVDVSKTEILSAGPTYVIDYRQLAKTFKVGELKTEYHPGTHFLKSVNAQIEGKEPEAVIAGIKLAAGIAKLALTGPVPTGNFVGPNRSDSNAICTDAAIKLLTALGDAKARLKEIPDEAADLADELATLSVRGNLGALDDADKARLKAIQAEIKKLAKTTSGLTKEISALEEHLSYSESWKIDEISAGKDNSLDMIPDNEKITKVYARLLTPTGLKQWNEEWLGEERFSLRAKIESPSVAGAITCAAKDGPDQTRRAREAAGRQTLCDLSVPKAGTMPGIVFRNPAKGRLTVCQLAERKALPGRAPPPAICKQKPDKSKVALLVDEPIAVPQLGSLRVLPLRSRWGENNRLEASFEANGQLASFHYNAKAAPGLAALNAANEGVTALGGVLTSVADYRQKKKAEALALADAAEQAEIDVLTHQIDLRTKQAALNALENPKPGDPALEALQARLAILRLQKEERELTDAINAP